jgi:hypothetical protein
MSTLNVDKIIGVSTAGSITVTGEGNSVTTNLQQGLAKVWCNADNEGNARDSTNISTVTDEGVADVTYNYSNTMANDDYAIVGSCKRLSSNEGFVFTIHSQAASSARARHSYLGQFSSPGPYDHDIINMNVHGDLA